MALAIVLLLLIGTPGFGGDDAPQLALRDLHGNTQEISQYKGKIVVLNFWAT